MSDDESDVLDRFLADDDVAETPDVESVDLDNPSEASPPEQTETVLADGVDRGDGRDNRGKFASQKDIDAASEVKSEVPVTAGTQTPDINAPAEAAAAGEVKTEAALVSETTPYVVKYKGQEYEVPGARVTPDGVIIAKDHLELVSTYLGKGIKLDAERAALREEKAMASVERARMTASNKEVEKLMQIAGIGDETQFAEALLTYGLELRAALPTLQREIALSEREARIALQRELSQPDPDEQVAQVEQQVIRSEAEYLTQMKAAPRYAALNEQDWGRVQQYMLANRNRFAYRVGQNPTPEEQAEGLRPGELAYDLRQAIAYADDLHAIRAETKAAMDANKTAVEQAKRVAEENARKLAKAQPPTPKVAAKTATRSKPADDDDEDEFSARALKREFEDVFR